MNMLFLNSVEIDNTVFLRGDCQFDLKVFDGAAHLDVSSSFGTVCRFVVAHGALERLEPLVTQALELLQSPPAHSVTDSPITHPSKTRAQNKLMGPLVRACRVFARCRERGAVVNMLEERRR